MKAVLLFLLFPMLAAGCCEKTQNDPPQPTAASASANLASSATTPDTCAKLCPVNGRCALRDGKCYAVSQSDCAACAGCRMFGYCSLQDGACVAASDDDCKKAALCQSEGRCAFRDGKCVKPE